MTIDEALVAAEVQIDRTMDDLLRRLETALLCCPCDRDMDDIDTELGAARRDCDAAKGRALTTLRALLTTDRRDDHDAHDRG